MRIAHQKLKAMQLLAEKEGKLLGPIRRLHFDSKRKAVVGLTLKGKGLASELWVKVGKIQRLGEDVIFVAELGVLSEENATGRDIRDMLGLPVTSMDGKQLGLLEDIIVDTDNWSICSLVLDNGGELEVVPQTILGEDAILFPKGSAEAVSLGKPAHSSFLSRVFGTEHQKAPTQEQPKRKSRKKSSPPSPED